MTQAQDQLLTNKKNYVIDLTSTQSVLPFKILDTNKQSIGHVSIQNGVMKITGKGDFVLKIPEEMRQYAWDIDIEGKVIFESDLSCDRQVTIKSDSVEFQSQVYVKQTLKCDANNDVVFKKKVHVGIADIFAQKLVRSFHTLNAKEIKVDTDYFSNKGGINISKKLEVSARTVSNAGLIHADLGSTCVFNVEKGFHCDPPSQLILNGSAQLSGPVVALNGQATLNECSISATQWDLAGQVNIKQPKKIKTVQCNVTQDANITVGAPGQHYDLTIEQKLIVNKQANLSVSGGNLVIDTVSVQDETKIDFNDTTLNARTWYQKSGTTELVKTVFHGTKNIFIEDNAVLKVREKSTIKSNMIHLLGEVECSDSDIDAEFLNAGGAAQRYSQVNISGENVNFEKSAELAHVKVKAKKLSHYNTLLMNHSVLEVEDCSLFLDKIEGKENAIKTKSLHIEHLDKANPLNFKKCAIHTTSLSMEGDFVLDDSFIYSEESHDDYTLVQTVHGKLKLINGSKIESKGLIYTDKDTEIEVDNSTISSQKMLNQGLTQLRDAEITSEILMQIKGRMDAIKSKINASNSWFTDQSQLNLTDTKVSAVNASIDATGKIKNSDVTLTGKTLVHTDAALAIEMIPQTKLAPQSKRAQFKADDLSMLGSMQVSGGSVVSNEQLKVGTQAVLAANGTDMELNQFDVNGSAVVKKGYLLAENITVTGSLTLEKTDVEVDKRIDIDAHAKLTAQMSEVKTKDFTSLGKVEAKATTVKATDIHFAAGSHSTFKGVKLDANTVTISGSMDVGGRTESLDDYQIAQMPKDGDCLFHAIAHQLQVVDHRRKYSTEKLRNMAVAYIKKNKHQFQDFFTKDDFNTHLEKMACQGTWGGQHEINALASALGICIVVFQEKQKITHGDVNKRTITLYYNGNDHYDSMVAYTSTQIQAHESLSTGVISKISGENLQVESNSFTHTGKIDLTGTYNAKGKQFINLFGRISAKKSMTLGYDYYAANILGSLSSAQMTINSNILNMGLFNGKNVSTNGFVNVSLGGITKATNYHSRALVSLNYGAVLTLPDFSQGLSGIFTWSNAKRLSVLAVNNFAPQYAGLANFAAVSSPYMEKAASKLISAGKDIYENVQAQGFSAGINAYKDDLFKSCSTYGSDTFNHLGNLRMHEWMPLVCDATDLYKSATQIHSSFQQASKDYDKLFNASPSQPSASDAPDVSEGLSPSTVTPADDKPVTPPTAAASMPETQTESFLENKATEFAKGAVSIFGGSYMQQGLYAHNSGLEVSYDAYHSNWMNYNDGAQLGLHTYADNSNQYGNEGYVVSDKVTVNTDMADNKGDILGFSAMTLNANTLNNHQEATIKSAHTQMVGKTSGEKLNQLNNDGVIAGDRLDINAKAYTGSGNLAGHGGQVDVQTMLQTGGEHKYEAMNVHINTLTTTDGASIDLSKKSRLSVDEFNHGGNLQQNDSTAHAQVFNQTGVVLAENHSAVIAAQHNIGNTGYLEVLNSVHIAKNLHAQEQATTHYENASLITKNTIYDVGTKDSKKDTTVSGINEETKGSPQTSANPEDIPAKADAYIMHGDSTVDNVQVFANDYQSDGTGNSNKLFVEGDKITLGGKQRFEESYYQGNMIKNSAQGEFVNNNQFFAKDKVEFTWEASVTGPGKVMMGGGKDAVMNAKNVSADTTVMADEVTLGAVVNNAPIYIKANKLTQTKESKLNTHQAVLNVATIEQNGEMNLINDTGEVFISPLSYHHVDKNASFVLTNGETPPLIPEKSAKSKDSTDVPPSTSDEEEKEKATEPPQDRNTRKPQEEELPKRYTYNSKETEVEGHFYIQDGANANIGNLNINGRRAKVAFTNSQPSLIGQIKQNGGNYAQNNAKVTVPGDYKQKNGRMTLANHSHLNVKGQHKSDHQGMFKVTDSTHQAGDIHAAGKADYNNAHIYAKKATFANDTHKKDTQTDVETDLTYADGIKLQYNNSALDAKNIHNGSKVTFADSNLWKADDKISTNEKSAMDGNGSISLIGKKVDPGAVTTAKVHMEADNINVNNAIHAQGEYAKFKPTEELSIKTTGDQSIKEFAKGEKRTLAIETDAIATQGVLNTEGNLFLTSTKSDINVNHDITAKNTLLTSARDINATGVDIKGRNHVKLKAKNNINLMNTRTPYKGIFGDRYRFKSARVIGGKGEGMNGVGAHLHAKNKINMRHSFVMSDGTNILNGRNGIKSTFDSYVYKSREDESSGFFCDTKTTETDTHIGRSGIMGKENILISDKGGLFLTATTLAAPEGNYTKIDKEIRLKEAIAVHKKKKEKEYLLWIKSTDRTKDERAEGVDLIDDKQTLLYSLNGNIRGTGVNVLSNKFVNLAPNGVVIYDVSKLKHTYDTRSYTVKFNGTASELMNMFHKPNPMSLLKNDPAVRDVAQLFSENSKLGHLMAGVNAGVSAYNLGQELCQNGLANTLFGHAAGSFNPSVGLDFSCTSTHCYYETASLSRFNCNEIIVIAGGKCDMTGIELNVAGDMSVKASEFNYNGVELSSEYKQTNETFSLGVNLSGNVDAGYSQQETSQRGLSYAYAHGKIQGNLNLDVDKMKLDAGIINTGNITGRADELTVITRQDVQYTDSQGFGLSSSGAMSANYYHAMDKQAKETAGLHAKGGLNTDENPFKTNEVNLVGGQVTTDGKNNLQAKISGSSVIDKHIAHGQSISAQIKDFIPQAPAALPDAQSGPISSGEPPSKSIKSLLNVTASTRHLKIEHQATVAGGKGVTINPNSVSGKLNTDLTQATKVIENKTQTLDMRAYDLLPLQQAPAQQPSSASSLPKPVTRDETLLGNDNEPSDIASNTTVASPSLDLNDTPMEAAENLSNKYGLPEFMADPNRVATRKPILGAWSNVQCQDSLQDETEQVIAPKAFCFDPKLSQLGYKAGGGGYNQLYNKAFGQYTHIEKELEKTSAHKVDVKTEVIFAQNSQQTVFLNFGGNNAPTVEGKTAAYYKAKYEPASNQLVVETGAGVYTRVNVLADGFDAGEWGSINFAIDAASFETSLRGKCNVSTTGGSIDGTASVGLMGPSASVATTAPALNLFGWTIQLSNETEVGVGAKATGGAGATADVSRLKAGLHFNVGMFFGAGIRTRNKVEVGVDFKFAQRLGDNAKELFDNDAIAQGIIEKMKNYQPVMEWEHDYIDDLAQQSISKSRFKNK